MARQLLLSDEEEKYLTEVTQANLKGLDLHDIMHDGPCATSIRTRGLVKGLMRKLGIEVAEDPAPGATADTEFIPPMPPSGFDTPPSDLADMARQMSDAMSPVMKELTAGRIERFSAALSIKVLGDLIAERDRWPDRESLAIIFANAIGAAQVYYAHLDVAEEAAALRKGDHRA